jgi:L-fuconate dehydratase
MKEHRITSVETKDVRFPLRKGAGSDAVHSGSAYAFATTLLASSGGLYGTGIVLTLGEGNQLICEAIELLGKSLVGQEIEELMASSGAVTQRLARSISDAADSGLFLRPEGSCAGEGIVHSIPSTGANVNP